MNARTKQIVTIAVTAVPALMVLLSGIMKLTGAPEVVAVLSKAGVGPYIPIPGTMELVFTALFIYPKTMKLGFILMTCYFAGAMAVDLSNQHPMQNAAMVLSLIWIAAFVRDKSIFLPTARD